ncbi:transglutaminase-like domain-containing protein [Bacillus anthracis]|uniref:transglutaminase-like domain-containing protein n=1 Tax=Bacillus anthracis TaxID=1392 RepID=UPI002DBB0468|nr:transglutaminase-like domain-containing protein [Bacillus anthracis]MEB9457373.1 transglutaminase-like domain-containing protein [Bacillus anthracis]
MSKNNIKFKYKNDSDDVVKIWLSAAPNTTHIKFNLTPIKTDHPFLGTIYYFEVPKKESLIYKSKYTYCNSKKITDSERAYFLRDSKLIPVNASTIKRAHDITSEVESDIEKAKKIFNYIIKNYKYSSRIKERGFNTSTKNKVGDCGELSAIFASYCRSLGIPCRVMVGAFRGKDKHHTWNEAFFEGLGWTPIDVSVAMYTFFRMPIANIGSTINLGLFRNKKRYFGEIERGRVVFSIDPERELAPVYNDTESTTNDMVFTIAEENFAWGYHSISGKAPYMQPIYPQLNKTYKKIKNKDVLGTFNNKVSNIIDELTFRMKINSILIAAVLIYFLTISDIFNVDVHYIVEMVVKGIYNVLLGIFGVLSLIRKEYNIPILILSLLFSLSLFGFVYQIIKAIIA